MTYSFPTRSRCKHCGSLETRAHTTRNCVQYRKCDKCGMSYKEIGWRV